MKKAPVIVQMGQLFVVNVPFEDDLVLPIVDGHGQEEADVYITECGGDCFALSIYPRVGPGERPSPQEVTREVLRHVWRVLRDLELVEPDEMPDAVQGNINAVFPVTD